jgi:hypothetical protein
LLVAVSDAHAALISTFLLGKFPSDIERYYDSVGHNVISRLSHTLENLPFAAGRKPDGLDDHLRHGKMALAALNELRELLQGDHFFRKDTVAKTNKRTLPRTPQMSGQSKPSSNLEGVIQSFETLGHQFPRTRHSAEETTQKIIDSQRKFLKVYLPLLSTSHAFRNGAEPYTSFSSGRFGTVKSKG